MEPVLPPAESVVNQFNMRPTFLVTDGEEDDRLNAASWLSTTMGDDSDQEPDRVGVPLLQHPSYIIQFVHVDTHTSTPP